jgi:rifampicin phosphotransferase
MSTWLPDPSHYPEQMTPLSATVWFEAMGSGLHAAARELRTPFGGFATRTELGWAYELELAPEWAADPDHLRAAALSLPERWRDELLPGVRAITEEIEAMRPDLPTPAEAAELVDRLWELVQAQWRLHFLTVVPAQIAAEVLHDEYVSRYPDHDELAAYRFLEGIDNPADDAVRELAELARTLAIDDLLVEYRPGHALARLQASVRGRKWLHSLDAYLLRFGGRARWHELSVPREAEHPALTLESIRLLLETPEPSAPAQPAAPPPDLADLVARVRAAYALKELHTYDIDYPGLLATREALLGFGRRLWAEGVLGHVDEVWLLHREELRRAVGGEELAMNEIVPPRRAELARGLAEGPTAFLGDAPPSLVDRNAALAKFYGTGQGRGAELAGAAASPGQAVGTARVVQAPEDLVRVEPGDVLVATTTTPAWTPLFASISGLVTETGGILSHAAVVAREYRIPAVVGVAGATQRLIDGTRIRIDGSRGTIEVL